VQLSPPVTCGLWFAGAYLVGSVNLSLVLHRLLGLPDPRSAGSGNAGATNVFRSGRTGLAAAVLLADVGRAVAVGLAARLAFPWSDAHLAVGLFLIAGNVAPLFHRFRGGKGIATVIGFFLGALPAAAGIGLAVWVLVFLPFRRASVSSLAMVASYPATAAILGHGPTAAALCGGFLAAAVFSHRSNLARLVRGEEAGL